MTSDENSNVDENSTPADQPLPDAAMRWDRSAPVPPQRAALRFLAWEVRRLISGVVRTRADKGQLVQLASEVGELADRIEALPSGGVYEGVREAALAGDLVTDGHMIYDHSPLIGEASPIAPPVRMEISGDRVIGTVTFGAPYEGPPGFVHGGFVAAAFDELLGAAQCLSGGAGMTAHLGVNYRKPTPLGTELQLEGRLDRVDGRKVYVSGECRDGDQVTAEATGLFILFDQDRFRVMQAEREDRLGS